AVIEDGRPGSRLILADGYDRAAFARALDGSAELREILDRGETLLPGFRDLAADLHAAMFRWAVAVDPDLAAPAGPSPGNEPPASAAFHHRLLLDLIARPEFQGLREVTVLDEGRTAGALLRLAGEVQRAVAGSEPFDAHELVALREIEWMERELSDRRRAIDE